MYVAKETRIRLRAFYRYLAATLHTVGEASNLDYSKR